MNKKSIKRVLSTIAATCMLTVALISATVSAADPNEGFFTNMDDASKDKAAFSTVTDNKHGGAKALKADITFKGGNAAFSFNADILANIKSGDVVTAYVYVPADYTGSWQQYYFQDNTNWAWNAIDMSFTKGDWAKVEIKIPATLPKDMGAVGFQLGGIAANTYVLFDDITVTRGSDVVATYDFEDAATTPTETTAPAETTAPSTDLPKTGSPVDFAAAMSVGAIVVLAGAFIVFKKRQLQ